MSADCILKNLQVVVAANRAAGLDGHLQLDNPEKGSDTQYLSADELIAMNPADILKLAVYEINGQVYPDRSYSFPTRRAVLFGIVESESARCEVDTDETQDFALEELKEQEWNNQSKRVLEPLQVHANFLRKHGLLVDLDFGKWREDGYRKGKTVFVRKPRLIVAAVLSEAVDCDHPFSKNNHPVNESFDSLLCIGGMEGGDVSIPLTAPIFSDRRSGEEIVKAAAIAPDKIVRLAGQWESCGRSHLIYSNTGTEQRRRMAGVKVRYLVPGLIPLGMVTVLAGRSGDGKSTLMHELAVTVGTPPASPEAREWLGIPMTSGGEPASAAFVAGEGGPDELFSRVNLLDPHERATRLSSFTATRHSYKVVLRELAALPNLRLVVVDPARKFCEGSEDDSSNISEFFDELENLAAKTGCAVVVVHHLSKSAKPRSASDVREQIRGSGVFVDRARSVLGLWRQRDRSFLGVAKCNPLGMTVGYTIGLRYDTATLRHLRVDESDDRQAGSPAAKAGQPDGRVATVSVAQAANAERPAEKGDQRKLPPADAVLTAIRRFTDSNTQVTRTGGKSLFGRKAVELMGFSRAAIGSQTDVLIKGGQITVTDGQLSISAMVT
jgi:hypothetical protein